MGSDNKRSYIWLFLTCPEELVYNGNLGYDDQTSEKYSYDSSVPNHLQIKEGDISVLRDKKNLLGLARIERIEEYDSKKLRNRCPTCQSTKYSKRTTIKPEYRCIKCHKTFDIPDSQYEDCRKFIAYFGNSFIPTEVSYTHNDLKHWCLKYNKNNSVHLLYSELIRSILLEKAPQLSTLLLTDYSLAYIKADDAESEDIKDESSSLRNSITNDCQQLLFRQIVARRGQLQFRNALRKRYGDRCMITGCKLIDIVEASHILPYSISNNNNPDNGLLLRTDLHTLFDLDFLGIDPESLKIDFHPIAIDAGYKDWQGQTLLCSKLKPNKEALARRWRRFLDRKNEVIS